MAFGHNTFAEFPFAATRLLRIINVPRINLTMTSTSPTRERTTNPAPAEAPWRDEDELTDGWTEESEAA